MLNLKKVAFQKVWEKIGTFKARYFLQGTLTWLCYELSSNWISKEVYCGKNNQERSNNQSKK